MTFTSQPEFVLHPTKCMYLSYLPRIVIDVGDKPTLLGLVDLAYVVLTEPVDEFGQRLPYCGVHVDVMTLLDVLLVGLVRVDPSTVESKPQQTCVSCTEIQ